MGGLQLPLSVGPGLWIVACYHSLRLGVVFESSSGLRKYLDRDQQGTAKNIETEVCLL